MRANLQQIKRDLKACKFKDIFTQELGWDNPPASSHTFHRDQDRDQEYTFSIVADKKGFLIYQYTFPGRIPEAQFLIQLDKQLEYFAASHLTIFVDANHENQAWLWVKIVRDDNDKIHSTPRLHRYNKNQNGESLVQKIDRLFISLDEEENITLTSVLDRVMQAFDVEKVTKTFYDLFKIEHANFLQHIEGIPNDDEHLDDRKWYTSIMLNRLMFVYFLQRKKVLDNRSAVSFDGDRKYLENRLKKVREEYEVDKFYAFYRYFLRSLFHDGLNRPEPHSPELERLIGKIPHINGGIFDVHDLEKRYRDIQIKDEVFERLFKFFRKFDWHLDDRPMRSDNEINPDVLGYTFEKYINQKQMGAYYTKEDITEYISKNSIIPFIFEKVVQRYPDAFRADGPIWLLLRTNPSDYIYEDMAYGLLEPLPPEIAVGIADVTQRSTWNRTAEEQWALLTETWREVVERRRRYEEVHDKIVKGEIITVNDLITYNLNITQFARDVITSCDNPGLLHAFYDAITQVTVLDPTCGSGAFLFAALNILKPLYQTCIERMRPLVAAYTQQQAKLPATQRIHDNHIAAFQNTLDRIGSHRNQEYFILKTITVNNLYGVDIMEEAIEICKLRLFLKLVAQIETPQELEPLPDIDFNMLAGNTLIGFTNIDEVRRVVTTKLMHVDDAEKKLQQIEQLALEIKRDEQSFRDAQTKFGIKIDPAEKERIRAKLSNLRKMLDPYLAANEYAIYEEKYSNKIEYEKVYDQWQKSHQPFHWWAEFYEIMENGGFDVIVGNPPYVEYKNVKKVYEVKNYKTEDCQDLYAFVMERMQSINHTSSCLGMIVPVSIVSTDGFKSLRTLLNNWKSTTWTLNFAERPSKLFTGVEKRLTIWLSHYNTTSHDLFLSGYRRWVAAERDVLFSNVLFVKHRIEANIVGTSIPKISISHEMDILKKITKQTPLRMYFQGRTSNVIYYTRKLRYFVQFFDFVPSVTNASGDNVNPSELKNIYLTSGTHKDVIIAILNSNLFFWFFNVYSDVRNINRREIETFRFTISSSDAKTLQSLVQLAKTLQEDFKKHSKSLTNNYGKFGVLTIQTFQPRQSKSIIDEIDRILAQHYGFTPEELDFIINYDIKYRMGRDNGEESEE